MFSDVNDFIENGFFSDVWLHSEKCFRKYFGHFEVSRYFWSFFFFFLFRVILVILEVSMGILII